MSKQKSGKRALVVGGGFGSLHAARSLKRSDVDVTLIDRRNFHLFQPLLYQVASGVLSPANIASPIRAILGRQKMRTWCWGKWLRLTLSRKRLKFIGYKDTGGLATIGRIAAVADLGKLIFRGFLAWELM